MVFGFYTVILRVGHYRTLRIISAPNVPSESYNALSVSKNNTGIKK
jgi:hypothetical protein